MSKLIDAITATPGIERRSARPRMPMVTIQEETFTSPAFNYRQEYRIEARFGVKAFIDMAEARHQEALERCIQSTRKALVEHIFGEFRAPLAQLRWALSNEDVDEAREIVEQLHRSMFDI